MRRTFLAALTVATALCGLPATQTATAVPSSPQRASAAQAGPEEHCGGIQKISGGGNNANVKLCAKVGQAGRFMNIATGSNCWNALHTWKYCDVTGPWKMFHEGKQVADGPLNSPVPYVGPGTYEVVADVSVHAHDDSAFSGTRLHDTMTSTFTLTSERKDPPYTVEVTPGQRNQQGETSLTFTATHQGKTETQADLMIWGHGISTATPGCKTYEGRVRDEATFVTCGIGKGEKKTVELAAAKVEPGKCPVTWELSWLNGKQTFGIEGNVPCA
ncbi:hypothetical protein [Streptomyces kanamyceticus]|uniref:Uncharacterized protein n=1 Tax=Streptomyces kanamyceticus TaxID=1967 RepID=A0A5J6GV18_STRKN|nr:hypothetical protein [Streptomyces kanamyceticus]QEU96856.1 hypothetical protein CP970_43250 [Streptomyces kanamyceticus]